MKLDGLVGADLSRPGVAGQPPVEKFASGSRFEEQCLFAVKEQRASRGRTPFILA